MSYTDAQTKKIEDTIRLHTKSYLGTYEIITLVKQAREAMKANKNPVEVADAVYNYAYKNNSDNIVFATALQQCMPKPTLLILRQELIKILEGA